MPKLLIVARYFTAQQAAIREQEAVLESVTAQMTEMEEEHGGEEGAFSELDKVNKANVAARLKAIKGPAVIHGEMDRISQVLTPFEEDGVFEEAYDIRPIARMSKPGECHLPLRGMVMNEFGRIVQEEWLKSAKIRAEVELGAFVVMPNHFHGIVNIAAQPVGAYGNTPNQKMGMRSPAKTIGAMVRGFKSAVTKDINETRKTPSLPVWQRNYYEHVIRNEADYNRIAEYVATNPYRWIEDTLHPANCGIGGKGTMGRKGNIGEDGDIVGDAAIVRRV